ncbi:MAG: hypothetical protein H7249_10605 [Chitinophagaceae bacterium]|nr:hypothetical protein [Oligoflexus sp.]
MEAPFEISELVTAIRKGSLNFDSKLDEVFDCLQSFECWTSYFHILEQQIDNPKKRQLTHYVRTARAYAVYLEDINKAARVCVKLMKDLRLSYLEFREKALYSIVDEQDYGNEAILLQAIYSKLKSKEDTIACMERLCLIYEKKKYDEYHLNRSYERLIELDPFNQKALRYFKIVYTQNNQWDKVAQVLQNLFTSAKHVNDRYRSAQELAAVYLYQLDSPQNSVDVIEKYCADSPLSTFAIHYEAYYRLQNWDGCLRVLAVQVKKVDGNLNKALLTLRMGDMHEKSRRPDDAIECYKNVLDLAPNLLEPLEKLADVYLKQHNWAAVLETLNTLDECLDDQFLKEKVREGISRLQSAMEDGQKDP